MDHPYQLLLSLSLRTDVGVLTGHPGYARAHLYADARHTVVGSLATGAQRGLLCQNNGVSMQDVEYGLPRIFLLRLSEKSR